MKRIIATVMSVMLLATMMVGFTGCKSMKKQWYKNCLEYYKDGMKNGFTKEFGNLHIPDELKDKNNKVGYLLRDLDGDGIEELLIGLIDDGIDTKFTNVIVRHSSLGDYSLLNGSGGYYIYLCSDNVLRVDSWYGSKTEKKYMRFNSKNNSFTIIEGEGQYLPMKWELTEFER